MYLAGLAQSRCQAKQFISHKHVLTNGKKLNVSSYSVKVGDEIALDKKITDKYADFLPIDNKDFKSTAWIESSKKQYTAKVTSLPSIEDINSGVEINLIIEYYSR